MIFRVITFDANIKLHICGGGGGDGDGGGGVTYVFIILTKYSQAMSGESDKQDLN